MDAGMSGTGKPLKYPHARKLSVGETGKPGRTPARFFLPKTTSAHGIPQSGSVAWLHSTSQGGHDVPVQFQPQLPIDGIGGMKYVGPFFGCLVPRQECGAARVKAESLLVSRIRDRVASKVLTLRAPRST